MTKILRHHQREVVDYLYQLLFYEKIEKELHKKRINNHLSSPQKSRRQNKTIHALFILEI